MGPGAPTVLEHPDWGHHLVFSSDSSRLAVGTIGQPNGPEGVVQIWDVTDLSLVSQFANERVQDLHFIPGTHRVAGTGRDRVLVWDGDSGRVERTLLVPAAGDLVDYQALAFSGDGALMAVSTEQRRIGGDWDAGNLFQVLRTSDFETVATFEEGGCARLRFFPDGNRLFVARLGMDGIEGLEIRDIPSSRTLGNLDVDAQEVLLSPEGSRAVVASDEIRLLDLTRDGWEPLQSLPIPAQGPFFAFLLPDASAFGGVGPHELDEEGLPAAWSAWLWDSATGRELWRAPVWGKAYGASVSPGGTLAAIVSGKVKSYFDDDASDFVFTLRDGRTGEELSKWSSPARKTNLLTHHPGAVVFSPDGRWIAVNCLRHVELWKTSDIA